MNPHLAEKNPCNGIVAVRFGIFYRFSHHVNRTLEVIFCDAGKEAEFIICRLQCFLGIDATGDSYKRDDCPSQRKRCC